VQPAPKKPFLRRPIFITIIIVIIIVGIVAVAIVANYVAHPPVSTSIVDSPVNVAPGTTQQFTISIPNSATNALVSGTFSTTGGSGNDIIVYVYDSYGNVLYTSGQVSAGSFSVSLSGGSNYSLVFDNTFSTVSSKTVNAQATLTYDQ
jgi:hypothetical protein